MNLLIVQKLIIHKINKFLDRFRVSIYQRRYTPTLSGLFQKINEFDISIENIFDVGAYRGLWSLEVSKYLDSKVNFYLFEPNEVHNKDLKRTGFQFFNYLLSDKETEKIFFQSGATGDSYYPEYNSIINFKKLIITTKTIDGIVNSNQNFLPIPDLIKLDTQGSEIDILRGAVETLKKTKIVILECPILIYNLGAPKLNQYVEEMLKHSFVPFALTDIHILKGLLIQIDIAFIRQDIFNSHIGKLDLIDAWKLTSESLK